MLLLLLLPLCLPLLLLPLLLLLLYHCSSFSYYYCYSFYSTYSYSSSSSSSSSSTYYYYYDNGYVIAEAHESPLTPSRRRVRRSRKSSSSTLKMDLVIAEAHESPLTTWNIEKSAASKFPKYSCDLSWKRCTPTTAHAAVTMKRMHSAFVIGMIHLRVAHVMW